ncbi:MAG: arginine--tRNA ligase [Candidatus Magasanikbacteria bacterium RIFCSPLOWO2_02_FULL_44_11]|uniref:Arginine--tRNA ligase n=2 Tax=Candidatus Magasanikiibacteriota TaxID=1752731 RepID=A0A1F6NAG2_9BACT|nr:MAG: arginine--tRNA ligase [Candidatus Magasanikbacteria bacterium RIFCSPHIGHO2_02_FULL_45_10]OGH80750.1 MAG: arginine--tRNA ligase [Candidatus Magasanikbacteria bacterium RIFCSPLOWO2_02_FULL_44_11]
MNTFIREEVGRLLHKAGVKEVGELATPPKAEMGDVAFPCFTLSKTLGKNPAEIAKEIASKITVGGLVERVAVFGPYVNFILSPSAVIGEVVGEVLKKKKDYGALTSGKGNKILLEYPSNNTHKEFHIGHFRNVCIGNTLTGLYRATGSKPHVVNYLNDFGSHVAKCLWGLLKFHGSEKPPANKQKWLGEIYAEASRYLKDHPEAESEVVEIQKKLEAKDKSIWKLFMETREWSIEKFDGLFKELGVKHEAVFYEKDIKAKGQKIVDELLKKKIAEVGEGGAIIVDLTAHGLDIALVRKSNGVGLYLTSDLPLAEEKFQKYKVDESIVITAQEQQFYFRQLYKILELMGFKKKLTHISYGFVTLPEGKMSSRTGKVILYEDLRDQVYDHLLKATQERHADWPKKKIKQTARALALAALKFDMQKHDAVKNIVFDIKEATSVEGFSGPYVLYSIARINSILRKAGKVSKKVSFASTTMSEEKRLALLMGGYSAMLEKALEQYNPSVVARYCFDLAQAFNDFYAKCPILTDDDLTTSAARLALSQAVKNVLINGLSLLSISPVEEM